MIVVQYIFDALSVGGQYALAALGIGLIFGIMRLINFAHGELIMMCGYAMFMLLAAFWPLTILGGVAIAILLSLLIERVAFRPLREANPATLLAASFAVSFFLQNLMLVTMGGRTKGIDLLPELSKHIVIGTVSVPRINVFAIVLALVLMVLLALFLGRTRLGVEMRAAAEDFRMARMLGVRTNAVIATAFAISGLLAAAVSIIFISKSGTLLPNMGLQIALIAFVSTVIGGMGSLPGAALGGFAVGIVTVALQATLPLGLLPFRDAFIFGLVLIFLLLRPGGLMRVPALQERV